MNLCENSLIIVIIVFWIVVYKQSNVNIVKEKF
jgi:hypothetical protein